MISMMQGPLACAFLAGVLLALTGCGGSGSQASGAPPGPEYLYVAAGESGPTPGVVYQFKIAADGSLSPLDVASVPTGLNPTAIVSDPSGKHVYVLNPGGATISQYSVGAGGELTPLSPATVQLQSAWGSAAVNYGAIVEPSGHFLYAQSAILTPGAFGTGSVSITQYLIGSDGALTLSMAPYTLPGQPNGPLVIGPSGQYVYYPAVGSIGFEVAQLVMGADGVLSPMNPGAVAGTPAPVAITFAPESQSAYVVSSPTGTGQGQIARYIVNGTGQLTATGETTLTAAADLPMQFLIDSSGSNGYLVANYLGQTITGQLFQYAIDSTGRVTAASASPAVTSGVSFVSGSLFGHTLCILSSSGLDLYTIDSNGTLSALGSPVPLAGNLTAMTVAAAQSGM